MKQQCKSAKTKLMIAALTLGIGLTLINSATPVIASGGSGGSGGGSGGGGGGTSSVDTIKVTKAEYAVTIGYVELLISASSSNPSAVLYAYLPDGTCLGLVQNGGGGQYGGTVFLSSYVPVSITIKSSARGI